MSVECFLLFLSSPRVIPLDRFHFVLVSSIVDRKIETVPRSSQRLAAQVVLRIRSLMLETMSRSPSLGNVPFIHMEDVFSELPCVSFP